MSFWFRVHLAPNTCYGIGFLLVEQGCRRAFVTNLEASTRLWVGIGVLYGTIISFPISQTRMLSSKQGSSVLCSQQ